MRVLPFVVLLSGCSLPIDDFKQPATSDAALTTNGDAADYDDADHGDTCVCVKQAAGKCREWSSAACAK
jgi:hypothetical protein